jgi:hypothetical protein
MREEKEAGIQTAKERNPWQDKFKKKVPLQADLPMCTAWLVEHRMDLSVGCPVRRTNGFLHLAPWYWAGHMKMLGLFLDTKVSRIMRAMDIRMTYCR